jgi:hypothetical protein
MIDIYLKMLEFQNFLNIKMRNAPEEFQCCLINYFKKNLHSVENFTKYKKNIVGICRNIKRDNNSFM